MCGYLGAAADRRAARPDLQPGQAASKLPSMCSGGLKPVSLPSFEKDLVGLCVWTKHHSRPDKHMMLVTGALSETIHCTQCSETHYILLCMTSNVPQATDLDACNKNGYIVLRCCVDLNSSSCPCGTHKTSIWMQITGPGASCQRVPHHALLS